MKTVTITLKQNAANLVVTRTVDTELLSEISGTLVYNIDQIRKTCRKYKQSLNGFSFNRKFEIEIKVDDKVGTLNKVLSIETILFTTTLTDNSFANFAGMVNDLVIAMLTESKDLIVDFAELFEVNAN